MKTINNNTLKTIILSENEMNMVSAGTGFSAINYMFDNLKSAVASIPFVSAICRSLD